MWEYLTDRPLIVAITGPNGAGKSSFYATKIAPLGLPFINADVIAAEQGLSAYEAAEVASRGRSALVMLKRNFAFETVFSDPVQDKVRFLEDCVAQGYRVVLFFIGLDSAQRSAQRVALRARQQGHDVPTDKLASRYPRSLTNLSHALKRLPIVVVIDNSDLANPFRQIAIWKNGAKVDEAHSLPAWYQKVVATLPPPEVG